jgi:hypothetical protein
MVVYLVEVTTVEQLVEKLKKGKYKSEADVRAKSQFVVATLKMLKSDANV